MTQPQKTSGKHGHASAQATKDDSLGERLQGIIDDLPADSLTLSELRDALGQEGMLLFAALLTLVFLIPVSIPGVSTVFGAAILLIGVCRLFNRTLWLPRRVLSRPLPAARLRDNLGSGLKWFQRLERISRPHRWNWLTTPGLIAVANDAALILGALLLMMPFGLIPFSNTLPAIALLLLAIGLLQRDGVCIALGHLANVATIVYFGALISGSGLALNAVFKHFSGE